MNKLPRWFLILVALFFTGLVSWRYFSQMRSGQVVTGLVQNPSSSLKQTDNRTQLAFLGVAGEGHAGSDLTDSIIIFSYNHSTHQLTLIPIPRDLWIPSLAAKINTAYHYGQANSALSEAIGMPIHYTAVLDFSGFERMIDAIGGIDLTIERTFDDFKYPIPGKETADPPETRYDHLHFEAGPTHLSGATALKFARSRNSEGDEGTDFARSRRQELVINAFKNKLLSSQTLLNYTSLTKLRTSISDSLVTDLTDQEIGSLIRLFLSTSQSNQSIRTIDLTTQLSNPKDKSPYQGQWVLVPIVSFTNLHQYVAENLSSSN